VTKVNSKNGKDVTTISPTAPKEYTGLLIRDRAAASDAKITPNQTIT
jgi:hypothetical protein